MTATETRQMTMMNAVRIALFALCWNVNLVVNVEGRPVVRNIRSTHGEKKRKTDFFGRNLKHR
jgi:hypothetical protein